MSHSGLPSIDRLERRRQRIACRRQRRNREGAGLNGHKELQPRDALPGRTLGGQRTVVMRVQISISMSANVRVDIRVSVTAVMAVMLVCMQQGRTQR